ncbi:MAG: tetratricopeptide repeat protein [Proteobacteria bacterium]|nr:tetratricopeptide repeat protein [Pseudomonadota bacterium]MDE3208334.1 tetratricopeptide repeat protein [Pseudomonadota bacterium]
MAGVFFNTSAVGDHVDFRDKKVIIIDDFQGIRTMLREMLKAYGAVDIDTASDGIQALNYLGRKRYDVVLCDYNLGEGKSGQNILEEAKIKGYIPTNSAWIMITAEKTMDMVMGAAEYQPDDYIIKPINEGALRTRLEKILLRKEVFTEIDKAIRNKEYEQAIALCESKAKSDDSNAYDLLRMKTQLCLQTGKLDEAREIFVQILEDRSLPWARIGLGRIHLMNKDYLEARSLFEEVIEDSRTYLEAYDYLAQTYEMLGELDKAQDVLMRAAEMSPNAIQRQKVIGDIALKRKDVTVAREAFEQTIALGKYSILKSSSAYIGLAKAHAEGGQSDAAMKTLEQARSEFKGNAEVELHAAVTAGDILNRMGDKEQAQKSLAEALKVMERLGTKVATPIALDAAKVLLDLGDKERASTVFSQVIKNNSDNDEVIAQVKDIFIEANLQEEGQKLIESSRKEVVEINNKGVLLAKEGKLEDALELLRQAALKLPDNPKILLNYCQVMVLYMQKHGKNSRLLHEGRELAERVIRLDPSEKRGPLLLATLGRMK